MGEDLVWGAMGKLENEIIVNSRKTGMLRTISVLAKGFLDLEMEKVPARAETQREINERCVNPERSSDVTGLSNMDFALYS